MDSSSINNMLENYIKRWEENNYIRIEDPKEYWCNYWSEMIFNDIAEGMYPVWGTFDLNVELIRRLKLNKILCLGNGASLEAKALSYAGFEVEVLDISEKVIGFLQNYNLTDKNIKRMFKEEQYRSGGTIKYTVGDFTDPSICPGPYEVIITRRSLQYYTRSNFLDLLSVILGKLQSNSLFISHTHNAYDVNNAIGEYFAFNNFTICKTEDCLLKLAQGSKAVLLYGSSG